MREMSKAGAGPAGSTPAAPTLQSPTFSGPSDGPPELVQSPVPSSYQPHAPGVGSGAPAPLCVPPSVGTAEAVGSTGTGSPVPVGQGIGGTPGFSTPPGGGKEGDPYVCGRRAADGRGTCNRPTGHAGFHKDRQPGRIPPPAWTDGECAPDTIAPGVDRLLSRTAYRLDVQWSVTRGPGWTAKVWSPYAGSIESGPWDSAEAAVPWIEKNLRDWLRIECDRPTPGVLHPPPAECETRSPRSECACCHEEHPCDCCPVHAKPKRRVSDPYEAAEMLASRRTGIAEGLVRDAVCAAVRDLLPALDQEWGHLSVTLGLTDDQTERLVNLRASEQAAIVAAIGEVL